MYKGDKLNGECYLFVKLFIYNTYHGNAINNSQVLVWKLQFHLNNQFWDVIRNIEGFEVGKLLRKRRSVCDVARTSKYRNRIEGMEGYSRTNE